MHAAAAPDVRLHACRPARPHPPTRPHPQVRALVDLLPEMDVVEGDAFNSSPTDPKLMGPDVLMRWRRGEKLPAFKARTPLVRKRGVAWRGVAGT